MPPEYYSGSYSGSYAPFCGGGVRRGWKSGLENDALFSQDLDSARADPMEVKQHALAGPFEVTESAETRGLEGSDGGLAQRRRQRCG